ncbi:NAD(P)/FAD-dependent oxidoreductase [Sulfitobacter geojensis]|uniref:NAD(P)/FAD-dependent oxidoreductase n=1 Tax=Sulfitobacter geojensis TaxID=1342299 RepID=UPI0024934028|nr:FAD-binding oxidoreductase [Sulfitobacter geojensis]
MIPEGIHWHRTAPPPPACERVESDLTADVVIVGAGLTGLRAAITLAEAGVDVAVLDAEKIGFGSSGRSGGQCNPIWRATPDDLRAKFGAAQAERLINTTLSAADDLFDDIRRYNVECEAEQNGWVQAAHTRNAADGLKRLHAAWAGVGAEITVQSKAETHAAVGSDAYDFSLHHAKGGFVQPMALTRGYAKAAKAAGARLYEEAPAQKIKQTGSKWRIETPQGSVTAEKVILATNAYTDDLWPGLRQTMLPMYSISLATAPLTPEQQATVLPGRKTIADTRLAIYYARYDAGNRLIFGCVGSNDSARTLGGVGRLMNGLHTVFPQLKDIGIECTWAGRIGVTQDMMPRMFEPAPGVLAGVGFSGRGIAMTSVMGRSLARKVLGGHNDDLPFPVSTINPIPFHEISRRMVPLMAPSMSVKDRAGVVWDRLKPDFSEKET